MWCVMLANVAKVINFLFLLDHLVCQKAPLELVFSDVWGPAPTLVGKNKFYVSFIDDYSKFTWIFLLKYKFKVFAKFHEFQHMLKDSLTGKFLPFKWIGEENTNN
jgi:hypothetical protein